MFACLGMPGLNGADSFAACMMAESSGGEWTLLALGLIAVLGTVALARGGEFELRDV